MTNAILHVIAPIRDFADITGWIWVAIIAFWVISSVVGGIRRAARRAAPVVRTAVSDVVRSPQAQALERTASGAVGQTAAGLDTAATTLSAQTFGVAQVADDEQARQDIADALAAAARIAAQAATAASRGVSQTSRSMAGVQSDRQALVDTLVAAAGQPADAQTSLFSVPVAAPQPPRHPLDLSIFHTPNGLALAIVAGAVLGPSVALRTRPQEPGGW